MNTYKYIAKDKNGRSVAGILDAALDSDVAEVLHSKGLVVVSIEKTKKQSYRHKGGKAQSDDLVISRVSWRL